MKENYYDVYQLADSDSNQDLAFRPYRYLQEHEIRIRSYNYRIVFHEAVKPSDTAKSVRERLEKEALIFSTGRGLGTSDVITVTREGLTYAYYVDPDNLILIPDFFVLPSAAAMIALETTGYMIEGRKGSWMTVDAAMIDGKMYYLMLSEVYKRDAPYVILDEQGSFICSDPKGFTDESIAMIRDAVRQAEARRTVETTLAAGGRPELENWQKHYENGEYLRSAEITEEQNYNMLDGRINNKAHTEDRRCSVIDRLHEKQDGIGQNPNHTGRDVEEQQRVRK